MRRWLKSYVMPSGTRERRILLGPAAGLRMDLDPARELRFWLGVYEAELAKHFRRMVQPSMRCFDIGGAEGYHALFLARLSEMPVVVFEPGEEWTEKICSTRARNGLQGKVEPLFIGAKENGNVTTIDAMAEKHFVPDFIKMDIEGAEVDALAGAEETLAVRRPHMIVEVHGYEVERRCLDILERYGYEPQIVNPRKWLKEHRPIAKNRWLVCAGRDPNTA